ncbi:helix-turn-helix domain-containing protein [uncultured Polaribacter sp.]|uniref:helix-turn-helix domain-containing protein n=1 Tax=uncultured Polaribacter sp. TaxID=174711 RepID=UPI002619924F|nr:helix-turn-helix transcriptional regulator [uncultured Polaribacter sp.]
MKEKEKIENYRKAVLTKIIKLRNQQGLSQMDLADLIDIGYTGYFKVETGKTKLDTFRLFQILEKLDISPKEFFKDFK